MSKIELLSDPILTAGEYGTIILRFTVEDYPMTESAGIKVVFPRWWGWSSPQIEDPYKPGYVEVFTSNKNISTQVKMEDITFRVTVCGKGLCPGETITVTYGSDTISPQGKARVTPHSTASYPIVIWERYGNYKAYYPSGEVNIRVNPGKFKTILAQTPSQIIKDGILSLHLSAVDRFLNRAQDYKGTITLYNDKDKQINTFNWNGRDIRNYTIKASDIFDNEESTARIKIVDQEKGLELKTNPVRILNASVSKKLFWGDLHNHSSLSDGFGDIDEIYQYARDFANLDVFALTDHDNYLHHHTSYFRYRRDSFDWKLMQEKAFQYYQPGSFVTFSAYEWTASWYDWTVGHLNVYFLHDDGPYYSCLEKDSNTPRKIIKKLKGQDVMVFPHHIFTPELITYSYLDEEIQPLIQVYSVHGDADYDNPLSAKAEESVRRLLQAGRRVGIISSSDSHNGHPGIVSKPGFENPGHGRSRYGSLVGIYAEELTRESIWNAFKNRHVYAATGERIILDFKINGAIMGSEIPFSVKREIEIEIHGTDRFEKVELWRGQEVIYAIQGEKDIQFNYVDKEKISAGTYYYVKAKQQDGNRIWSSPIWLKE